jgi:hypothetical protein
MSSVQLTALVHTTSFEAFHCDIVYYSEIHWNDKFMVLQCFLLLLEEEIKVLIIEKG